MIKEWEDNSNAGNTRPDHIVISLLADGEVIQKVTLNSGNGWKATVSDLPVEKDGKEIAYTWSEQDIMGYNLSDVKEEGNTTTFVNTLWTRPEGTQDGSKVKQARTAGNPVVLTEIENYETPLGVEVGINHVGDCFE